MKHHQQQNNDFDLALAVGQLQGAVDGIAERLDKMNGCVAATAAKVAKHDIIFGKIGLVVAAIGTVISIISTALIQWFEHRFLSN